METGNCFKIGGILINICLFYTFGANASLNQSCHCRGPINYYKELGCTPVFKNPEDCCPIRYDCSVLYNLQSDECLVNGRVYHFEQELLSDDSNMDDWSCTCMRPAPGSDTPRFLRMVYDCNDLMSGRNPPCTLTPVDDCNGQRSNLAAPRDFGQFTTCNVDGKSYTNGEYFTPSGQPETRCYCAEGYTGENVEPYCETPNHTWCTNVLQDQGRIRTCTPYYSFGESLQWGCNAGFVCPSSSDVIKTTNSTISRHESINGKKKIVNPEMLCKFGNLTLQVGEELDRNDGDRCVCEVPPILTCQATKAST